MDLTGPRGLALLLQQRMELKASRAFSELEESHVQQVHTPAWQHTCARIPPPVREAHKALSAGRHC